MHRQEMLAAYDAQVRRRLEPDGPNGSVEVDRGVIRSIASGGWSGVQWSDLGAADHGTFGADCAEPVDVEVTIAAQVERFAGLNDSWEWKLHSYDEPPDLAQRLLAAGFTAGDSETLLVAEVADLALDARPPDGVDLVEVVDAAGAAALVSVHDVVFGGDHSANGAAVLAGLKCSPPTVVAVLAMAGERTISGGRIEFLPGTDFAGLWGGGTVPEWRGRGVFRALVAFRAAAAKARGFRYLQVDATAASRPILLQLGFVELATSTPFIHGPCR